MNITKCLQNVREISVLCPTYCVRQVRTEDSFCLLLEVFQNMLKEGENQNISQVFCSQ